MPLDVRLVGDDDGVIPASPKRTAPVTDSADLLRDVAGQVLHEAGELLLLVDEHEQVVMIRGPYAGAQLERRDLQGAAHHADDDLVERPRIGAGRQESSGADGARGDLDEDAVRPPGKKPRRRLHGASRDRLDRLRFRLRRRIYRPPDSRWLGSRARRRHALAYRAGGSGRTRSF